MVNSIVVLAHFKTNIVKVVQNQSFRKPSMRELLLQDREIETTSGSDNDDEWILHAIQKQVATDRLLHRQS